MVAATDVPLNADFQGGFAHAPEAVADNVRLAVDTGVAGISIEDSTADPARPLYEIDTAVIRTRAQIDAVVRAVAPKPVNLLLGPASDLSVDGAAAGSELDAFFQEDLQRR